MRRRPEFRRRVVFLEDYDMNVARYLVQGVDVWLNNPRRPLEASGTSGMKVLRQRRAEPEHPRRLVGARATTATTAGRSAPARSTPTCTYQDEVESRALYDLLEQEIVPLFYTRGGDGLPRGWIRRMKRSITTLVPVFNTNRMVEEYTERCYLPSHRRHARSRPTTCRAAKDLARWRRRLAGDWGQVRVEGVEAPAGDTLRVGRSSRCRSRAPRRSPRRRGGAALPRRARLDGRDRRAAVTALAPGRPSERQHGGALHRASCRAAPAASSASRCGCCRSTRTCRTRSSRGW